MTAPILERVRNADNLPSLPTVAVEVVRLTQSAEVSAEEVAAAIQNDPALTVKILKVVNSSLFGFSREIASLKHAMVILGLRTVKVMVLSFSLVESLARSEDESFDYESYWRRSLTTAVASRLLARATAPSLIEEAFVSGLLADLGMLAASQCAPDVYQPVLRAAHQVRRPLDAIERDVLGISHAELGEQLLRGWGLPDELCTAVGHHHGDDGEDAGTLGSIVRSGAAIAALFAGDVSSDELSEVKSRIRDCTGIAEGDLEAVLEEIDKHVRETAKLMSLQIGETTDYAQLQTDASMQLARLSMEAELERAASSRRAEEAESEALRLQEEKLLILEIASTDGLTKIANRAAFDKRLDEELQRARTQAQPISLLILDVDHFKAFNDTYGHQAGDAVLQKVAATLKQMVDVRGFVARYGGEEFAVIVPRESFNAAQELASDIRSCIECMVVDHEGAALHVTMSVGCATVEESEVFPTSAQLIKAADQCLYQAKRTGRNRVVAARLSRNSGVAAQPAPA